MSYWCYNSLSIRGDPGEIERFMIENRGTGHNKLCFIRLIFTYDNFPTRCWKEKYWGPPCDIDNDRTILTKLDDGVVYTFDTELFPPIQWVKFASRVYRNIVFKLLYDEPEYRFRGNFVIKNGVRDVSNTYHEDDYDSLDEDYEVDEAYKNDEYDTANI